MYYENGTIRHFAKSVKIGCTAMSDKMPTKRKYELKQRAAEMAETRLRITEATVELHGTIGPARTTVSAIAKRAGVQRHTVYRHFPTDADLFAACSSHFRESDPLPDPEGWATVHEALDQLYAYYERNESMYTNLFRDEDLVPAVRDAFMGFREYLDEAARVLARGRPRRKTVMAALRHAVDFRTWRSLARDGG